MSYVSTFNALNTTNTTSGQKLVLSVIASFERNGQAWPSVATIAKRCSMGARTVQRHIAALVSLGYLQRIYRQGKAAITRVFIGETPAKLAPVTPAKLAPNESVIFESVNDSGTPPATPEPQHQHTTDPVAAMPPSLFSDIEQPEQPFPAIPEIEQPSISTNEAIYKPVERSNEADPANPPTDTPTPAVADPVEEAVKALASLPKTLLDDMAMIRVSKKRPAKITRTEAQILTDEAKKCGWDIQTVITTMICHGWARFQADWVQHVPPQTAPAAPKVWTPEKNHTPASPSTIAQMKEKIARMKERWAASELAQTAPPMRQ